MTFSRFIQTTVPFERGTDTRKLVSEERPAWVGIVRLDRCNDEPEGKRDRGDARKAPKTESCCNSRLPRSKSVRNGFR